jgi:hypothetical protein
MDRYVGYIDRYVVTWSLDTYSDYKCVRVWNIT